MPPTIADRYRQKKQIQTNFFKKEIENIKDISYDNGMITQKDTGERINKDFFVSNFPRWERERQVQKRVEKIRTYKEHLPYLKLVLTEIPNATLDKDKEAIVCVDCRDLPLQKLLAEVEPEERKIYIIERINDNQIPF